MSIAGNLVSNIQRNFFVTFQKLVHPLVKITSSKTCILCKFDKTKKQGSFILFTTVRVTKGVHEFMGDENVCLAFIQIIYKCAIYENM